MNIAASCTKCDPGWCEPADALIVVEGIHVLTVDNTGWERTITVETCQDTARCPNRGAVAIGHGCPARYDTSASALARQLRVSWHTLWKPVKAEAQRPLRIHQLRYLDDAADLLWIPKLLELQVVLQIAQSAPYPR